VRADTAFNPSNRSQNADERISLRRSGRIETRNAKGPYSNVMGGGGGGDGGGGGGGGGGDVVAHHNWTPNCVRNGKKHKKTKRPAKRRGRDSGDIEGSGWVQVSEPANTLSARVAARAAELVCSISQGFLSNVSHGSASEWIQSMKALIEGRPWDDENGAFVVDSMQSLVMRCQRSLNMVAGLEFVTMVNMLQLAAKTDSYVI
jgi:hypothetical protein